MRKGWLTLLFAGPVLLLMTGCLEGLNCSEMACIEKVEVRLEREWEPGNYEFVVEAEGTRYSCLALLPPEEPRKTLCLRSFDDPSPGLTFGEGHATLHLGGTPKEIDLRVYREGELFLSRTLRPSYVKEEFNGPGCGFCTTGSAVVKDEG